MATTHGSTRYHSFILRLWQESSPTDQVHVWRISLEDPHSAERIGFRNIEALVTFLTQVTDRESDNEP